MVRFFLDSIGDDSALIGDKRAQVLHALEQKNDPTDWEIVGHFFLTAWK